MLKAIFGSAARVSVLGRLLLHPDEELHLRDIAAQTGLAPRSVQLEVDRLTKIELLDERRSGNRRYIRANQTHPLYEPLREVFERTMGVRASIRRALDRDRRIARALLFGAHATGEATSRSGVHLLVIGDAGLHEVTELFGPIEKALRLEINPVVMTEEEFRTRRASKEHFLSAVLASRTVSLKG